MISTISISCKQKEKQRIISDSRFILGTPLIIQVFEETDKTLLTRIFDKITEVEQKMSISKKDYTHSELLDINNHSAQLLMQHASTTPTYVYTVSPETGFVIQRGLLIAEQTDGAFDPTIAPLVDLWGIGSGNEHVPSVQKIEMALDLVDWHTLTMQSDTQVSLAYGQGIDVGGIAKGYAADIASSMLLEAGVKSALLDFGGNIVIIGEKIDSTPWKIGIQNPFSNLGDIIGALTIGAVTIDAVSVVTSGVYERYFEVDGVQYFHILDPKTGYPVKNNLLSVSIVNKNSIDADALSTGVFVRGLEKGMALVERLHDTEAIFVTRDYTVHISSGLQGTFELTNTDYRMN